MGHLRVVCRSFHFLVRVLSLMSPSQGKSAARPAAHKKKAHEASSSSKQSSAASHGAANGEGGGRVCLNGAATRTEVHIPEIGTSIIEGHVRRILNGAVGKRETGPSGHIAQIAVGTDAQGATRHGRCTGLGICPAQRQLA